MGRKTEQSRKLQKRAERFIPGGVNSPVRAFRAVGGEPLYIVRGEGSHIWDADGNEYVDYIGSWGPLILGHAAPAVIEAVISAAREGTSFGASTPSESELAELVQESFTSIEMMRFVSSGTEATMSAIRLARAFTGREDYKVSAIAIDQDIQRRNEIIGEYGPRVVAQGSQQWSDFNGASRDSRTWDTAFLPLCRLARAGFRPWTAASRRS